MPSIIGMMTYCSPAWQPGPTQGLLPLDFWLNVAFVSGNGKNGQRFAQRTLSYVSIFFLILIFF